MTAPLTDQQEALAQELAQVIHQAAGDDILHIARMLVSTDERHLFGDTEFQSAASSSRSLPKPTTPIWRKKKRLRRQQRLLPHCDRAAAYHGWKTVPANS